MQQNAAISERDNALLKCDNAIAALQSGFLEVESSYAFGCKAPDDNALSVNGGLLVMAHVITLIPTWT